MIRLLFDADAIRPPLTGIGYYALALAREFSRLSTDIELHCLQWGRLTELEYVERGLCQPVNPLAFTIQTAVACDIPEIQTVEPASGAG